MRLHKANVHTISGPVEMIDGSRNATIMLPNDIILHIEDVLLSTKTKRNLLSFKDVHRNEYNLETIIEANIDCSASYLIRWALKSSMKTSKLQFWDCIVSP